MSKTIEVHVTQEDIDKANEEYRAFYFGYPHVAYSQGSQCPIGQSIVREYPECGDRVLIMPLWIDTECGRSEVPTEALKFMNQWDKSWYDNEKERRNRNGGNVAPITFTLTFDESIWKKVEGV